MWISKQTIKSESEPAVQNATVTLNDNGEIETVFTGAERSIKIFAPYGYSYSVPTGSELLLTRSSGEQVSLGTQMQNEDISEGEIKITSSGGAYISLRNDGSVCINGLVINSEGVIE